MLAHTALRSEWALNRGRVCVTTPPKTDDAYWHKLVADNVALAYWCLHKFLGNRPLHTADDEWESEALLALTRAARYYDPNYRTKAGKPVKFITYAARSIFGALSRFRKQENLRKCKYVPFLIDREEQESELGVPDAELVAVQEEGLGRAGSRIMQIVHHLDVEEKTKEAFRLCYTEKLSHREVGERLGLSYERVRQIVRFIEKKVKGILCAEGGSRSR